MNTRRVAVGVLCVLLTWFVVAVTTSRPAAQTRPAQPAPITAAQPTADPGTGSDSDIPGVDEQAVTDLARRFAAAWLAGRSTPRPQWLETLRPLVSPRLLAGFTATAPENLPPGDVLDVTPAGVTPDGGTVRVALTTGTRYAVTVNTLPDGRLAVVDVDTP